MKTLTKVALSALSLASVAAISVAGTFAYLKDAESKMNVLTFGEAVDIAINEYQRNDDATALEDFEQGKKLYPIVGSAQADLTSSNMDKWGMPKAENYGDKIVTIENTGDAAAQIRVFIATPLALSDLAGDGSDDTSDNPLHTNLGNRVDLSGNYEDATGDAWPTTWGWDYNVEIFTATINGEEYEVSTYVLKGTLAPGAESTAVMAGAYLDSSVDYDDGVYTMTVGGKTYTIDYDLSQGVTIPVYAEAIGEGMTFADAATTFQNWADSVTGGVVAAPEADAVRPTAYIPNPTGETIDGLVVIDESAEGANLRALYNGEGGSANYMTDDLIIKNSYLDGTYAMNAYAVDGSDADLIVSDTELLGWVSYTGFASASFTNCTFDQNTNPEIYKTVRPYDETVFTNCDFAEGYEFWLDKLDGAKITLVNCTLNGVAITNASQLNIVYGDAASVVIQ